LDSAYNRCAKIGGIFRMHNLIWSSQQPTWLKGTKQLLTTLQAKKIDFIDVVN
jgi:GH35 family endo-1,4-beta-xylanase